MSQCLRVSPALAHLSVTRHQCWQQRPVHVRCHLINKELTAIRAEEIMLALRSQIIGRSVLVTQDTVPPLTLGDHNNVPAPLKLHNLGVF